jgi:Na+/H+-dicarboxylate symporter
MNAVSTPTAPGRIAKLLSVLSVAFFYVLPWAPMVAIAAVAKTEGTSGWPRRLAVTGAVLTSVVTIALGVMLVLVYLAIPA